MAATIRMVEAIPERARPHARLQTIWLAALLGADLALVGGYGLDSIGVGALALGATAIVAAPALSLGAAEGQS